MPARSPLLRCFTALLLIGASTGLVQGCRNTAPQPLKTSAPKLPDPAPVTPTRFCAVSRSGSYEITWEPVGDSIPLNESFDLDVRLTHAGQPDSPVGGAQVVVQASMPEHNHGMLREPRAHEVAPGQYRVEGMLLHMTGHWKVFVDVIKDGVAETAEFELTLE